MDFAKRIATDQIVLRIEEKNNMKGEAKHNASGRIYEFERLVTKDAYSLYERGSGKFPRVISREDMRKYFTIISPSSVATNTKERKFQVGDEVMYSGCKYSIIRLSDIIDSADLENDRTRITVWLKDLTPIVESPTVKDQMNDAFRYATSQLELDFDELTGEDESWNMEYFAEGGIVALDPMYCSCHHPTIKVNQAYGEKFNFCTTCRKERK